MGQCGSKITHPFLTAGGSALIHFVLFLDARSCNLAAIAMCGIAGIIQTHASSFNRDHLRNMTTALAHRGPDGEGFWQNEQGRVLLGHRRLSIIDLSAAGEQPFTYLDRYTIIHNGEIYNYIELKEALRTKGFAFRSQTDTEVVAAAYACWGKECVQHFDGMFAFVVWDEKENLLFAARDRFGEKPFFYLYDEAEQIFCFASEMKALWAAGISRSPNRNMLFNFITIGYTDNPEQPGETFDNLIRKLPPAHYLEFNATPPARPRIERYWHIDPELQQKHTSDTEAIEKFSQLFAASVHRRMRSDVAVGTSLSGGLDSSSVAAVCHELAAAQDSHKSFTASFRGFEKDELPFSKQVAAAFQLQQHLVEVSGEDLMSDWEKLCYHQEEPFGSASTFAQYKVYELAKRENVKVLIDGQGADETLSGYAKYYKWYWQELFRHGKLMRSGEIRAAKALGVAEHFNARNMIAAWFPGFAHVVLERQYLLKAIRQEDLAPEFVKQYSKEAYYTPPEHFTLNGVLHFNTCIHGLEELLRYADRNAMAHGRELRLPFLSHELVEFIFSLPARFKIRGGWTKWVLRETMKNKLPQNIVWRKDKIGFEPPQEKWMRLPAVQEAIHDAKKKLVAEKILKPAVLQKKILPLPAHAADNYDWRYLSAASMFK